MKTLRHLISAFVAVIGLSMAVSAQKDDQKKPPIKEPPPVINPGEKPPREKPPKGEDKPKKPSIAFVFASEKTSIDVA